MISLKLMKSPTQSGRCDGTRIGYGRLFLVGFRVLLLPRRAAEIETLYDVVFREIVWKSPKYELLTRLRCIASMSPLPSPEGGHVAALEDSLNYVAELAPAVPFRRERFLSSSSQGPACPHCPGRKHRLRRGMRP